MTVQNPTDQTLNPQPLPPAEAFGVNPAPDTVRFERLLPGPIERVWSYLVDSDKRAQWLASGDMPTNVGGTFTMQFNNARLTDEPVPERYQQYSGPITKPYEVTRFEAPRALGFTWGSVEAPSEVLFELEPVGERVRLTVTHARLDKGGRLSVSGGWHAHLAILESKLTGTTPPRFWTLLAAVQDVYESRDGGKTAPCSA